MVDLKDIQLNYCHSLLNWTLQLYDCDHNCLHWYDYLMWTYEQHQQLKLFLRLEHFYADLVIVDQLIDHLSVH